MSVEKINIIQFLPYFPPHKGGLEDFAEWISSSYARAGYGNVVNVVFSVGQEKEFGSYEKDGYRIFVLPAFDLVKNFPFPAFWKKGFWSVFRELRSYDARIVQTHTRFFLSSLIGGLYAKWSRKKWVHIEHGSGYVVSDKWIVTFFSRVFDRTVGLWIIWAADSVIAISEACKAFVQKEFVDREVSVIYRGMSVPEIPKIHSEEQVRITFIGRLVHLKGVQYLLETFKRLRDEGVTNMSLRIAGDGEDRELLQVYVRDNALTPFVAFLGFRTKDEVLSQILPSTDIFVNPSLQEGLPTTVIEALLSKCTVVATDVGGTREITDKEDMVLIIPGSSDSLFDGMKEALERYQRVSGMSYDSVREKFDAEENIERMHGVYKN